MGRVGHVGVVGIVGIVGRVGLLLLALVAFNIGVEVGQLAIVAVFLPIAYRLRTTRVYQRGVLIAGSAGIALIAGIWLIERAFNLRLLSGQ